MEREIQATAHGPCRSRGLSQVGNEQEAVLSAANLQRLAGPLALSRWFQAELKAKDRHQAA